jgi:regulator of sirC expression with transglutaminase-like and TPR domain
MRKPITYEVVVSVKENPMTIENDVLREDLRAWMRSPAMGLPEYSSQRSVQRRVGRMLANFSAKFSLRAPRPTVVNSIQTRLADKP